MKPSNHGKGQGAANDHSWRLTPQPPSAVDSSAPLDPPSPLIRVLLVDDHPVVIKGVSSCLSKQGHFTVVGQAVDGFEAVAKAKELSPDVVLMDLNMPNMGGLRATETVRRETPSAQVLVLTSYNHPDSLLRVLRCGAKGCVLKTAPTADLVRAIETVYAGKTYFSSELSQHAVANMIRGPGEGPHTLDLSNREQEVLVSIADGLSNKEIACRLNIAVRTVETHRERLIRKLNIHTTAGLTRFAFQKGLITVPQET